MTQVSVRNVAIQSSPCDEDLARADWYALLAALFDAPPAGTLLDSIAEAARRPASQADADAQAGMQSELSQAFTVLAQACSATSADAVRAEYEDAFLGVGKPEVFLNASYYLSGFLHERPLADLRDRLDGFGLTRREDQGQTEDQIAGLCEVMRYLIVAASPVAGSQAAQRAFFAEFIAPCFEPMCDALEASGATDFYKHAGRMARAFFCVEREAFDFD